MDSFLKGIGIGAVVFFVVAVVAILLAFPTMWTWNYVIPYLFHLKTIGPLQAFCLNFLTGTFFKSAYTNTSK